jgi:hypothetical protein
MDKDALNKRNFYSRRMTVEANLISVLLVGWFATAAVAPAQTLDLEISGLADKLSKTLVAKGAKNVAAIDFTDLQGQPTELGRFLSERLAIELVSTAGVSMLDRANIKSILAEHKLTEEGLVNPANAKKLGEFAGVDTILIGNVTPLDDGIELMVKAIATESAKIVAAGRVKFAKTSEIQQLLNRGISSTSGTTNAGAATSGDNNGSRYRDTNAIATKDAGPLRVVLKSAIPMKFKDRYDKSKTGISCSFEFVSRETQRTLAVAMTAIAGDGSHMGDVLRSTLVDDRGRVWSLITSGVTGMSVVGVGAKSPTNRSDYKGVYDPTEIITLLKMQNDTNSSTSISDEREYQFIFGSTTQIAPGQSATVIMNFVLGEADSGPAAKGIQISSEMVVGIGTRDLKTTYSLQNVIFDRVGMLPF